MGSPTARRGDFGGGEGARGTAAVMIVVVVPVVNGEEASVKVFRREGILTGFEAGAV